ncbi:hypothetical protein QTO34_017004 [Cnephaeus nilssonii]|uniref:Uncharacterized protein n=1 Tax=Cnephaeus nilssonii TaxID=3371016 RepID=A0AA40I3F7_CNENI|nr:hypothetical protein QTO34_017004 [Eptesicus nilssonii]
MGTKPSRVSRDKHPSPKGTLLPCAEKKFRPSTANKKHVGLFSSKSMPGERTKVGSSNFSQASLREDHDRPVFNGAGKTHLSTYSSSVPKTSAKGTQKYVTEHKAKKLFPILAIPDLDLWSPHIRLRVQVSGSQAAAPAQLLGSPSQGMFSLRLVLAPCPGAKMAAPVQDLSDQSVGPRGQPVALDDPSVAQVVLGSQWSVLVTLGGLCTIHMTDYQWSVSGPGRSVSGSVSARQTVSSSGPRRPVNSLGTGSPHKPKCSFVSETISSKNIITWPTNGQMSGTKPSLAGYRFAQRFPSLVVTKDSENMKRRKMRTLTPKWKILSKMKENFRKKYLSIFFGYD